MVLPPGTAGRREPAQLAEHEPHVAEAIERAAECHAQDRPRILQQKTEAGRENRVVQLQGLPRRGRYLAGMDQHRNVVGARDCVDRLEVRVVEGAAVVAVHQSNGGDIWQRQRPLELGDLVRPAERIYDGRGQEPSLALAQLVGHRFVELLGRIGPDRPEAFDQARGRDDDA